MLSGSQLLDYNFLMWNSSSSRLRLATSHRVRGEKGRQAGQPYAREEKEYILRLRKRESPLQRMSLDQQLRLAFDTELRIHMTHICHGLATSYELTNMGAIITGANTLYVHALFSATLGDFT